MFFCTYEDCGATFKKRWRLVEHLVHHTGEKPFSCSEGGCNKAFSRKSHLQRHLKSHSGSKDFECQEDGCGQKFVSNDNLKKHMKRIHQERVFKCSWPDCGKTFKKHQQLKYHTCYHTSMKPHVCDHEGCGKSFPTPSKLKSHKKTHEGYSCDFPGCDVIVYKWTLMRKHKAEAHKSTFQCQCCGKEFKSNSRLKSHMKVHDSVRDVFECPYKDCQRLYAKLPSLKLHVCNYHEGARPFACSHEGCVKTFANKVSLVKHQVVHAPGYCKPPSNPKRKRSLASRLSGHPDGPSRGKNPKKLPQKEVADGDDNLGSKAEEKRSREREMDNDNHVQASVTSTEMRLENQESGASQSRNVSDDTSTDVEKDARIVSQTNPDSLVVEVVEKLEQAEGTAQDEQKALILNSSLTLTISNEDCHQAALEQRRSSLKESDLNMNQTVPCSQEGNICAPEGMEDGTGESVDLSQGPSSHTVRTEQDCQSLFHKESPENLAAQFDKIKKSSTVEMRPQETEEDDVEVVKRLLNLDCWGSTSCDVTADLMTDVKGQPCSDKAQKKMTVITVQS
ncbi:Transcription factor IIIA [Holothuria leucospilota]|uniref:Transcription factor IIIA n=1 Tax=Holothuria leucospilota TaxID=206669 RepID=A0A9Q1BKC6_HOLLE|nr:Transcription factor IIIA [Holothuria leucospilota]